MIYERLRDFAKSKKISQNDLAKTLGWTDAAVSRVFNGQTELGERALIQITQALGVSDADLFYIVSGRRITERSVQEDCALQIAQAEARVYKEMIDKLLLQRGGTQPLASSDAKVHTTTDASGH